jgi:hypothetical protein
MTPKTFFSIIYSVVGVNETCGVKVKKKKRKCSCAELIKHYAMKAYGGVDIYPHFLDLGTSWR